MAALRKILCPVDFSEASYEGLRQAVELSTPGITEICVVHVEAHADVLEALNGIADASEAASRRAEVVMNLSEVLEERVPASVNSRPLLRSGDAAGEIVRAAKEEGAQLIVLTTHGAAGWRPGVLGSVTEEVIRTAPCPVLTIGAPASGHSEEEWFAEPAALTRAAAAFRPAREKVASNHIYLDGD